MSHVSRDIPQECQAAMHEGFGNTVSLAALSGVVCGRTRGAQLWRGSFLSLKACLPAESSLNHELFFLQGREPSILCVPFPSEHPSSPVFTSPLRFQHVTAGAHTPCCK